VATTGAGRVIEPGRVLAEQKLATVTGEPVLIPDAERLVHLQFRRFAGCPICNLHLHSIIERHDEIAAAGIREVAVFHSSESQLRAHHESVPFALVADPTKHLYREFGTESAARSLLAPAAWLPIVRGLFRKRRLWRLNLHGGPLGLPAEFLIAPDGRVRACKYGTHAYDQWTVDELLALAKP